MTSEQEMIQQLRDRGYKVEVPNDPDQSTLYIQLEKRLDEFEMEIINRSGLMSMSLFSRMITAWGYIIGFQIVIGIVLVIIARMLIYLIAQ